MILEYTFKDEALLNRALTHRSCGEVEADGKTPYSNQRLEFLGDSVLGLVIAELLYRMYPTEQEGDLAKRFAALVRGETLAEIAASINLGSELIMTDAEADGGGESNPSNLEDACEALIGAIYLDGGIDAAREFILTHWKAKAETTTEPPKDPKTALQEWAQGKGYDLPAYKVIEQSGPSHAPEFTIEASVNTEPRTTATAQAGNKKLAEREAAKELLEHLER